MTIIKRHTEIERIKKSGSIIRKCHQELYSFIQPGTTTLEIDNFVETYLQEKGAVPSLKGFRGYPFATCCSVNESVAHEPPSSRILKKGDIVSVDITAGVQNYHADRCVTYAVGKISPEKKHLIKVTKTALDIGVALCRSGVKISEVGGRIEDYVLSEGCSIVYQLGGHGIGESIHEEPIFPHIGGIEEEQDFTLKGGMVITIEPMVNKGLPEISLQKDGWTYKTVDYENSAHFEHTVLVTQEKGKILT